MKFFNYLKISTNDTQKYIKPYKVDALKNNTVYEFLGDYWHGNPTKYKPENYNTTCKKKFGKLYTETLIKFKNLKRMGYDIKYIWESDWKNFERGIDSNPKILTY